MCWSKAERELLERERAERETPRHVFVSDPAPEPEEPERERDDEPERELVRG